MTRNNRRSAFHGTCPFPGLEQQLNHFLTSNYLQRGEVEVSMKQRVIKQLQTLGGVRGSFRACLRAVRFCGPESLARGSRQRQTAHRRCSLEPGKSLRWGWAPWPSAWCLEATKMRARESQEPQGCFCKT